MFIKFADGSEKNNPYQKTINWDNSIDSNNFMILGIIEQGNHIDIAGNKIAVIEFNYFYLRLDYTNKKISIYEKDGFKEEMLEEPEYKKMIEGFITYAKKTSLKQIFKQ